MAQYSYGLGAIAIFRGVVVSTLKYVVYYMYDKYR